MATLTKEEAFQELSKLINPPNNQIAGLPTPFLVTQETLDKSSSLSLDPSDVWIVTFPKAGTTWTQQIVKLIRSKGEKDGELVIRSIPWAEANDHIALAMAQIQVDLASMPKPRAFKSHMPYHMMPCGKPNTTPCKYIYVARNPKDVVVSFFFHYCRFSILKGATLDWNLFFRNFLYGNVHFGDIFDHVLSWWAHKDDENVLFLKFEDMKKDLPAAVSRIAKFIRSDISDDVVAKIAAETTFDKMKDDDTANNSISNKFAANPNSAPFMRKGEVGDWKNHFTPEQSAELDKVCCERLAGTGLTFDYGDS